MAEDHHLLTWVLAEIQKSLAAGSKALHRFAHENAHARATDITLLQQARSHVHQVVGVLQMVGQVMPARMLEAMEFVIQHFVQTPRRCDEAAVQKINRAGHAVSDFLRALLAGKHVRAVALFPQYREGLALVDEQRVHPADLWLLPQWHWANVQLTGIRTALVYDAAVCASIEREVFAILESDGDVMAARRLHRVCLDLACDAAQPHLASFWTLAAAFFEALSNALVPMDIYVRRTLSRMLSQCASLAQGNVALSGRLGRELLFFCTQAASAPDMGVATLHAVRRAWGVADVHPVNYNVEQFGRFEPVMLAQVRKGIEAVKAPWASLCGGELNGLRQTVNAFEKLCEALQKLHPQNFPMAQALRHAVDASLRSGRTPAPELAMEVSTSLLWLEAAMDDGAADDVFNDRIVRLALRIERVCQGGSCASFEPWMEVLYRQVSDRRTMETIVGELRHHLHALEQSMNAFFHRPREKGLLRQVPMQLTRMRGVFSVLGLEPAEQTVCGMEEQIVQLMACKPEAVPSHADALSHHLGALDLLVEAFSYQPMLSRHPLIVGAQDVQFPTVSGRAVDMEEKAPSFVVSKLVSRELPSCRAHEAIKTIGPLRISTALFNVYLNEADEWLRQLVSEVKEWSLQPYEPPADSTVALAHSLAGSSATVGFRGLADAALLFESALEAVRGQAHGDARQGATLAAAAAELRRLLHRFGAGFWEVPDEHMMQSLRDLIAAAPAVECAAKTRDGVFEEGQRAMADAGDRVDPDLFPIFEEEAAELLPRLGGALREWSEQPANAASRAMVLRALHTLKGSARLAGAMRLGEHAHRMESEVEANTAERTDRVAIEQLLMRFDMLQACFDLVRGTSLQAQDRIAPRVALCDFALESPADGLAVLPASPVPPHDAGPVVRIRTGLLDRLLSQTGEIIITRSRLEAQLSQLRGALTDLTGNLDRLRRQLHDVESQAESQMQSRFTQTKNSSPADDPLAFDRFTRMQELMRMMAESVNDVATVENTLQQAMRITEEALSAQARQTRDLQQGLLRTRMVEFDGLSERLDRVVSRASKDAGKPVRLDIQGGHLKMDRCVLDRMTPAFEHLLRNCVAHGIEDAPTRLRSGKAPVGRIVIELHHEGNDVVVAFRDDGAGLDLRRIAECARAKGLVGPSEEVTPERCAQLIFLPGFSTASHVTELAGRGVGMDVVLADVTALGGRVETHSKPGEGAHFKLVLPLTTAVAHVVMMRAGDITIGVPSSLIEGVVRLSASELEEAYAHQRHAFDGMPIPFFWAGALLQSSVRSESATDKSSIVVVARSAAQRVAMHVDEVLGTQEVVVKNLGPQLARLPGMAGISVLSSGAVALIYNPVALVEAHGEAVAASSLPLETPSPANAQASRMPLVLVVDDSVTVRHVTQRMLQREGYRVALAADGFQALEQLQQERPALVLSDIEMPRMDGFDLIRNLRADPALTELPVIMITSRIAEKHREHARQLGVVHYLGKPYAEEDLMRVIHDCSAQVKSCAA